MMEPLTALGLVSNVFQILEFSWTLVNDTREFMSSSTGALQRNDWIEESANRNKALAEDLKASSVTTSSSTKIEIAVEKLATRCTAEADKLITLLEPLKVERKKNGSRPLAKSAVAAVRSMLKKDKIEECQRKLESLEYQLAALLVHSIRSSQSEQFAALKDLVSKGTESALERLKRYDHEIHRVLKDVRQALVLIQQKLDRVEQLILTGEEEQRANTIMQSLCFDEMDNRRRSIDDHHRETYEWIFSETETPFKKWLTADEGIFWVSGEPASGKSVLMRFLREHEFTQEALKAWAGNDLFVVASHYFWAPGTVMDTSIRGMLQNILHQILLSHPGLVKIACVSRWGTAAATQPWDRDELLRGIEAVSNEVRLCMFLDGLDECQEREHSALVSIIKTLFEECQVKVCVSSRPWTIFKRAFQRPANMIAVERLNRKDIFRVISDRLRSVAPEKFPESICRRTPPPVAPFRKKDWPTEDPAWQFLFAFVQRANGSFLWTVLVLDTICTRLEDGHSIPELRKFLEELPSELEDYLEKQVYGRISATYRGKIISETAMALSIKLVSRGAIGEGWCSYIGFWYWLRQSVLEGHGLHNEPNFGSLLDMSRYDSITYDDMVSDTTTYLSGCCRGLLKCIKDRGLGSRVEYAHRTVYDFLLTPRVAKLIQNASPDHFQSSGFYGQLLLLLIKSSATFDLESFRVSFRLLAGSLVAVSEIHPIRGIENALSYLVHYRVHRFGWGPLRESGFHVAVYATAEILIRHGCCHFLQNMVAYYPETIYNHPHSFKKSGMLTSALFELEKRLIRTNIPSHSAFWEAGGIETILQSGVDPNVPYEVKASFRSVNLINTPLQVFAPVFGRSPWHHLLLLLSFLHTNTGATQKWTTRGWPAVLPVSFERRAWINLVHTFARYGADFDTPVCSRACHYYGNTCYLFRPCRLRLIEHVELVPSIWDQEHLCLGGKNHKHDFRSVRDMLMEVIPQEDHTQLRQIFEEFSQPARQDAIKNWRTQQIKDYPDDVLRLEDLKLLCRTESYHRRLLAWREEMKGYATDNKGSLECDFVWKAEHDHLPRGTANLALAQDPFSVIEQALKT